MFIPYCPDEDPPYAGVKVILQHQGEVEAWAKIDTGAAITIVPVPLLDAVMAPTDGAPHPCMGYDGQITELYSYQLNIVVSDSRWPVSVQREFAGVIVIGVPAQEGGSGETAEILIGRDLLQAWCLVLDGPRGRYAVKSEP